MHDNHSKIQEGLQQKRRASVLVDSKTGQKLFSPRITQKSKAILRDAQVSMCVCVYICVCVCLCMYDQLSYLQEHGISLDGWIGHD